MSGCEELTDIATSGVEPALRAVDCLANETAASAFGRLFGTNGDLMPALTIALTLYIAFFAVSLLTGRSRLGISALTPRMMGMGLVLTFVTSWVAYQSVVWNLAVGGPDQIAGVMMGTRGSATELFASRIDTMMKALAEIGQNTASTPQGAAQGAGTFTPANLMWLSALMMLLGTVGILVTARIALAVLLGLGPVFIVLALFKGTRGLFAGWVRGMVMTALAPLFAVLGGNFMLELAVPVISRMHEAGALDATAVMGLFLIAAVHVSLMTMVLSVLGTMVSGWTVFGLAGGKGGKERPAASAAAPQVVTNPASPLMLPGRRSLGVAGVAPALIESMPQPATHSTSGTGNGRALMAPVAGPASQPAPSPRDRARGIGSRYRAASNQSQEKFR